MRAIPRIAYLACFAGLAVTAALALDRAMEPSAATTLVRAGLVATLCACPGLVYRRLWALGLVLLPVGCYLFLRATLPFPGWVEGAGAQYSFYTNELRLASSAYRSSQFPLDIQEHPEISLLLAFVLYWAMGAAAFVGLSLRQPIPGLAISLIVLGFGLTVDSSPRALWLVLLFALLATAALVLARAADQGGWRPRELLVGLATGGLAFAIALGIMSAAPSLAAKPWQDWRAWDPFGGGSSTYTFNWLQNYPRLLDPANNVPVMEVESPYPSYWRAAALDNFTGSAWVTSRAFIEELQPLERSLAAGKAYVYPVPASEPKPQGITATQHFRATSLYTNYVFAGGDPVVITFDHEVPLRMNDLRAIRVSQPLGPDFDYSVMTITPKVAPRDLVGRGTDYPSELAGFLTLPFPRLAEFKATARNADLAAAWRELMTDQRPDGWEWAGLYQLNKSIVGDAVDPYQITLRIEQHLRQAYSYTLTPRASTYTSPYAAFLFDTKAGYCQHFAGAMAILLRYNGIPSRVAMGFTAGEKIRQGTYKVTTNNAHAWVEVYFPGVGWLPFDPTPGRNLPLPGPSSTTPGFVNPFTHGGAPPGQTVTTLPPPTGPRSQAEKPTGSADQSSRSWLAKVPWLPWILGLGLLLVMWPSLRRAWSARKLHWGPLEKRLGASLKLLRAELAEFGAPVRPGHTYEELLQLAAAYTGVAIDHGFADRLDAVFFGGQSVRREDLHQAEIIRKEVRQHLVRKHRMQHGWWRTLLVQYGLRAVVAAGTEQL